jgi:hypothetical protein
MISLKSLREIDACDGALSAFEEKFGDVEVAEADVFKALAENNKRDWCLWLAQNYKGFIPACGELHIDDWRIKLSGELLINTGLVFAFVSATVQAFNSATVEASGSATVRAYDSATVRAYDSATVRASGSATVRAYDSATVRAYGLATVQASGSATVEAYDSATVRASGSATVQAYGSATVLLTKLSLNVKFGVSLNACAVDRRASDKPKLILAEQECV